MDGMTINHIVSIDHGSYHRIYTPKDWTNFADQQKLSIPIEIDLQNLLE